MSDMSGRRKQPTAEETAHDKEEQLRLLLDNMEDMVCRHLPDSTFIYVSPSCLSLTGYTPEELIGTRAADRLHPDDAQATLAMIDNAAERHDEHFRVQHRVKRKDGRYVWVEVAARLLYGPHDRLREIQCVVRDVTDRKQAEEALRRSEERYRAIAENMPVLICRFLPGGEITFVNEAYCKYFAKMLEELVGRSFLSLILEADREAVMDGISALSVESPTQSHEHRVIAPNGEIRWQRWTNRALFDARGQAVAYQSLGEDVTEHKQAEQEAARFNHVLEGSLNEIYIFDARTLHFVHVNYGARENLGYSMRELYELTPVDLKPEFTPELFAELIKPLQVDQQQKVEFTTVHRRKDGTQYPVEVHLQLMTAGTPVFVAIILDITERKRTEEEREELIAKLEAQNAELERFTYTVSHDLKSPLITIKGYVGMLRQDLPEANSGPVADDLSRISNAADKMDQLLQDLLELSRVGRLVNPSEDVSLEELAHEARELVHGQVEKAGVQVEISGDLPTVFGDRVRLLEVLQNLIDNAVKYRGDRARPRIEIGSRRDGNQTICYVHDNGIGIDPRYHEKVFGLFDQLDQNANGTGIGLALARRIVEVHGGRIWVESEGLGHGSTFCFTIAAKTAFSESGRPEPPAGSR